ncbi:hypothetical protein [Psychroserpens sp. Hel_I_66]|uniref:hypothetical protein n=1 Tax=Psychroserpens sp. Hel_I_66 TaxID=1250004 RepID=UPI000647355C|nr:hypothetical protein [Psychroserpens sp. Hel_I_66]
MLEKLFKNWELDTWANVLEIVGFGITIISLIVALFVKSELSKLKLSYIFDTRIKGHLKSIRQIAGRLNNLTNDYDENRDVIKKELRICSSELRDLKSKMGYWEKKKASNLAKFIEKRLEKPFAQKNNEEKTFVSYIKKYPNRLYKTTYDDVWEIYGRLYEVINQVDNIRKNKDKSL